MAEGVMQIGDMVLSDRYAPCNGEVRKIAYRNERIYFWLFGQGDEYWTWMPDVMRVVSR